MQKAQPQYQWKKNGQLTEKQMIERKHISRISGVCGGRACIAGHRIRVMDIVVLYEMRGYCADEIVMQYPGISLGDVHAALAYYFDNMQEIKDEFAADETAAKDLLMRHPSKIPGRRGP